MTTHWSRMPMAILGLVLIGAAAVSLATAAILRLRAGQGGVGQHSEQPAEAGGVSPALHGTTPDELPVVRSQELQPTPAVDPNGGTPAAGAEAPIWSQLAELTGAVAGGSSRFADVEKHLRDLLARDPRIAEKLLPHWIACQPLAFRKWLLSRVGSGDGGFAEIQLDYFEPDGFTLQELEQLMTETPVPRVAEILLESCWKLKPALSPASLDGIVRAHPDDEDLVSAAFRHAVVRHGQASVAMLESHLTSAHSCCRNLATAFLVKVRRSLKGMVVFRIYPGDMGSTITVGDTIVALNGTNFVDGAEWISAVRHLAGLADCTIVRDGKSSLCRVTRKQLEALTVESVDPDERR